MDLKWMLLFKGNVFSLPVIVQKTLFDHYMAVLSELDELSLLEKTAVQNSAVDVFLWAAKHRRYFRLLDEEQIVVMLRELMMQRISKQLPLAATLTPSQQVPLHPNETLLLLPEAWEQVLKRIHRHKKRRLFSERLGSVGFMITALVFGGFIFGMVMPIAPGMESQVSASTKSIASSTNGASPNQLVEGPITLTELKLKEQEVKNYADFKMYVPAYLPSGYTFDEGLAWIREGESKTDHTMLVYMNDKNHLLRVTYYKLHKNGVLTTGSFGPESSKEIFIRGTKALLVTSITENSFIRLDWTENDTFISIFGRELEEEELVKMAKSLK
ncbi:MULTISPECIES: DUF4367 domain-containing protein [unclassified Paenibacillus]|uniref:DUF4367 domain-containing protein n=1 Tax=unclassified Paenibacillus TaxID=185978 RepID=UPI00363E8FA4